MANAPTSERRPTAPSTPSTKGKAEVRPATLPPEERRRRVAEAGKAFADANAELLARLAK